MHFKMLMSLCLYAEDVVFLNDELQKHPSTLPVFSLQDIIPKLGVTLDDDTARLLVRDDNESGATFQEKKKRSLMLLSTPMLGIHTRL